MNGLILSKGIILTNDERIKITGIIRSYIQSLYKYNNTSNTIIVIDGKKLDPEILNKMPNNRTLLKSICDGKIVPTVINNKEDLINVIKDNLFHLFNHKGKYFDMCYTIVSNTTNRGDNLEKRSFDAFSKYASSKLNLNIEISKPSIQEDINGIDGIFSIKGKRFTIQVKPLFRIEDYRKDNSKYIVFCDGVLKKFNVDYILVGNNTNIYFFRNPKIDESGNRSIETFESYFIVDKNNLLQ